MNWWIFLGFFSLAWICADWTQIEKQSASHMSKVIALGLVSLVPALLLGHGLR